MRSHHLRGYILGVAISKTRWTPFNLALSPTFLRPSSTDLSFPPPLSRLSDRSQSRYPSRLHDSSTYIPTSLDRVQYVALLPFYGRASSSSSFPSSSPRLPLPFHPSRSVLAPSVDRRVNPDGLAYVFDSDMTLVSRLCLSFRSSASSRLRTSSHPSSSQPLLSSPLLPQAQHKHFNILLNTQFSTSQQSTSKIAYSHPLETDTFHAIPSDGGGGNREKKVRVRTNKKTGQVVDVVEKVRLGDLNVYCPGSGFDWRLSCSIETPGEFALCCFLSLVVLEVTCRLEE